MCVIHKLFNLSGEICIFVRRRFVNNRAVILSLPLRCTRSLLTLFVTTKDFLFMGEAACRGPRERHSPGPNLALNGPDRNPHLN